MTLIRKKTELSTTSTIKILIYGQPGVGKSTLALSAPNPLLLDFDGGINRVNYGHISDTVQISSWDDCLNVLNEDLSAYQTIVIDTAGKMLDFLSEHIIKQNPKLGKRNGALTLQGFGERKGEFRQFCKRVMMLNKHLVFVAHRDTQRNGDEIRYVPLFGGSSYDDLVTDLDLVGYLETVGRQRTITFNPTDRNDGKNTCNLSDIINLQLVVDTAGNALKNDFITTNVITPYLQNLANRNKQGAAFDKVMDELKENINLITDEISANNFVQRIDKFEHAGNSKLIAGKLLNDFCAKLGLTLNKETKLYEKAS